MRSTWLSLGFVVLAAVSCGFPRLPELADGGYGADGGGDSGGTTSDGGPPPRSLDLLVGDIGGPGSVDGAGVAARFNFPSGIAVDSSGDVYVADQSNST